MASRRNSLPLTPEQSRLVEQYANVAKQIGVWLAKKKVFDSTLDPMEIESLSYRALINFARAYTPIKQLPFEAGLTTCIRNAMTDHLRRRKYERKHIRFMKHNCPTFFKVEGRVDNPKDPDRSGVIREPLLAALRVVTNPRTVELVERLFAGQEFSRAVAEMGIPMGTASTHLFRAKRKVRQLFPHLEELLN